MASSAAPGKASAASKSVFVASSKEMKNRAQLVVDELSRQGFAPLPWWDDRAFPPGEDTFSRLISLAQTVDAAVFLAAKDDRAWYRGAEVDVARDNVLLELGLFASRLGAKRSVILADGVKLPTDLLGITYLSMADGVELAAKRAAAHLKAHMGQQPPPSPITIISDPQLIPILAGDRPKNWLMRSFYFGTTGARAWLLISLDPRYQDDAANARLSTSIRNLIDRWGGRFRTFVSLGPGDARLDERIASILRIYDSEVAYVPIDISDGLLLNAAWAVGRRVSVPVGVLADFEERLDFVLDQVAARTRGPYLYAMLGNTFGNLDGSETQFIDGLCARLKNDDQFLLGVAVRKDGGAPVRADALSPGAIEFYAHGAACHLGVTAAEVKANFVQRVGFDEIDSGSEIPGTQTFKFFVKDGADRIPCANLRRFDLDALATWLEGRGLTVRSERLPESGPYDLAVLALQKA